MKYEINLSKQSFKRLSVILFLFGFWAGLRGFLSALNLLNLLTSDPIDPVGEILTFFFTMISYLCLLFALMINTTTIRKVFDYTHNVIAKNFIGYYRTVLITVIFTISAHLIFFLLSYTANTSDPFFWFVLVITFQASLCVGKLLEGIMWGMWLNFGIHLTSTSAMIRSTQPDSPFTTLKQAPTLLQTIKVFLLIGSILLIISSMIVMCVEFIKGFDYVPWEYWPLESSLLRHNLHIIKAYLEITYGIVAFNGSCIVGIIIRSLLKYILR